MSDTSNQKPTEDDGRRSVGLIAAAVFVGLLLLVGGIVIVTRDDDQDTPATTAQPTTTSAPNPGSSTATGFGIPEVDVFGRRIDVPNNVYGQPLNQAVPQRKPSDPDWLTAAPAGTRGADAKGGWQRVFGAVVPFSTSDGPTHVMGGVPAGYSHTPQGAALAAAFVAFETLARPSDRVLRERMVVMSVADLAEFDRLKAAGKIPDRQPESVTKWMLASDAFRINSWSDDLCVLQIAGRAEPDKSGNSRWLTNQIAMVWDGSAWKMRLPADNRLPQEYVYSLAGWTQW